MAFYTSKPVKVEAMQLTTDNFAEVEEWCEGFDDLKELGVEAGEWIVLDHEGHQVVSNDHFKTHYKFHSK